MPDLIGEKGKARIIAFILDNLFASLAAIVTVGIIKSENPIVSGTLLCLTYLLYFFLFETLWSRTPGKLLQGLQVRSSDGGPCTVKQTLIRTLTRIFEANPILFGGIPAGIAIISSQQRQRIGDILAGSVVVSKARIDSEIAPR